MWKSLPDDVAEELMLLNYMEHFHLSYVQAVNEPWEVIERAHFVWSLRAERDKLETKRQESKRR